MHMKNKRMVVVVVIMMMMTMMIMTTTDARAIMTADYECVVRYRNNSEGEVYRCMLLWWCMWCMWSWWSW